jgi:hypothetical protein
MILEMTLRCLESSSNGVLYTFDMVDTEGKSIVSFAVSVNSGKAYICQVGVDGVLPYAVYNIGSGSEVSLKIEAYTKEGAILLYVNGTAVLKTSVFASDDPMEQVVSALTVKSGNAKGVIALDDIRFDAVYSVLTDVKVEGSQNPETDINSGIDYESSSTSSIPSSVTQVLRSVGSYVDVKRVFNSYRDTYSNVLAFRTAVGNNDTLSFKSDSDISSYNGIAFESDIKVDYTAGNPTHRISFLTSDGKDAGYMILIRIEGNMLKLIDVSGLADTGLNQCVIAEGINVD